MAERTITTDLDIKEWLNNNELSIDIFNGKYRYNNETLAEFFARVSNKDLNIARLIFEKKFIFAGRTLANRGTNKKGSYSNCYSIGYVPDSLEGIMDVNSKIAMTFKSQGGQGLSLSNIRPKGSMINGQFESDGIIPFMEIFNTTTSSISQGGSRKGALMMSLDIWHKEADEFIKLKEDLNRINKANLSLEIDDAFMDAVCNRINEDILVEREYNGQKVTYTVNPVQRFKNLCYSAWKCAEPGVIFTDRFRNYNIMQYVDEYQIETCNPCGEQPLPKHGACNLSSINVAEYIKNPFTEDACFDVEMLSKDMYFIVRAMDDVLEENLGNHALPEQVAMAAHFRNIGIGIMGLHDAFIKMGVVYGSSESADIAEGIMKHIFREAVKASVKLAKERGNFKGYSDKVWDADIMKYNFTTQELTRFKLGGRLRNCSLISIAPTGSIGTFLNISTGCEPWFMMHYTRTTKSLNGEKDETYEVWAPIAEEAKKRNWHLETLVNSQDIDYHSRVTMQAILQQHCDTAISSTVNLKKDITPKEIEELYIEAWKQGLKGITIYRDGSRAPILASTETKEEVTTTKETELPRGQVVKADDSCIGLKRTLMTGCGTLHCTAYFDSKTGDLRETYLSKGSTGGCNDFMIGLSRMISLSARGGIKLDAILDQLKSCGTCPSYAVRNATKHDTSKGSCCPVAVGNALKEMQIEMKKRLFNPSVISIKGEPMLIQLNESCVEDSNKEECPNCHHNTLIHSNGCVECPDCGWSKCNL